MSVLLHRGSRVAKDFDVLRFSKASSVEQNFLADTDHDSRLALYPSVQQSAAKNGGGGPTNAMDSSERLVRNASGQRSPMSIRRTPNHVSKHQTMNIRKLTNSLFEDSLFTDQRNVIKEEEKERDEHD